MLCLNSVIKSILLKLVYYVIYKLKVKGHNASTYTSKDNLIFLI